MSLNVLVVDDSDVIRSMILKTMRLAGIPLGSVHEAANGCEALDILEVQWIDMVLADLNMPVMDGMEMIERIRSTSGFSEVPIVVITTEGAVTSLDRLGEMGVDAFIRKPFTPEQIRDVVEQVAGRVVGTQNREMLERVVGDMLTLFAMMCGEADTSDRVAAPKGRLLRAHMSFTGGVSGALTLIVPFELCREMAANVLGIDGLEDAAARHAGDAIGEFANMACGHLATTLEQREQTKLSPPQVDEAGAEDWDSLLSTPGTVRFMVEELPLLATLALRPE